MAHTRRITGRDFKNPRARAFAPGRWRELGIGLGVGLTLGLAVALAVYVADRRTLPDRASAQVRPTAQQRSAAARNDTGADGEEPKAQYDFYEMLPKFEVVLPEKERDVRRDLPAAKVDVPGVYVLQAGSSRNLQDAERLRIQLERQGIDAKVQRVQIDADVWHRVRVGPIEDLAELNRLRDLLRKADLDPLVIRVGD